MATDTAPIETLERAAHEAHRHNRTWLQFQSRYWWPDLAAIARQSQAEHDALVRRLAAILAHGDNTQPTNPEPTL